MECPTLINDISEPCSSSQSTLTVQVATEANIIIPVHFTTSSVHQSSVQKFKFPIKPPAPNHIQDKRSTLHIFQDMLGILNDTPKINSKFYLDLLLKRDSGVPEIDTDGPHGCTPGTASFHPWECPLLLCPLFSTSLFSRTQEPRIAAFH